MDDSLLMCKVNEEQILAVFNILKTYEHVSGQMINFAKSSITFGEKVAKDNRVKVKD